MPANLTVITNPHPHLRVPARAVDVSYLDTSECSAFLKNLSYTMRTQDGVGLAAIQVDVPLRIICIKNDVVPKDMRAMLGVGRRTDAHLINPVWFPLGADKAWDGEGCLSVPGYYGEVERHRTIRVQALLSDKRQVEFTTHEFFARVIQHEVDHLNGVLFIDKARNVRMAHK